MSYSKELEKRGVKLVVRWWRDRWRKIVGTGQAKTTKYFAYPDTRDGYERACADYYRWKDGLKPNARAYKNAIETQEALVEAHEATGRMDLARINRAKLKALETDLAKPEPPELDDRFNPGLNSHSRVLVETVRRVKAGKPKTVTVERRQRIS